MKYITEILRFYDLVMIKRLSTGQIALWHALMCINNKCSWCNWFTAPNQTIESLTGLSRQAIYKNRNVLKQMGLIDFKENGTKATSYKMIPMSNSLQESLQDGVQIGLQDGVQDSCTLNNSNSKTRARAKKKGSVNTPQKRAYGKHENVMLTENEYESLKKNHEELLDEAIEFLSEYIESNGYKKKSHYACMTQWVFHAVRRKRIEEEELTQREARISNYKSYQDKPMYQPKKEVQSSSWLEIAKEMETNQIIETEGTEIV